MKANELLVCGCGEHPALVEIGSWPAQYQAECKCGKTIIGPYYGSHDTVYRHRMAKKDCIARWNKVVDTAPIRQVGVNE